MIIVTPKIPILTSLFHICTFIYNLRTPARDHEGQEMPCAPRPASAVRLHGCRTRPHRIYRGTAPRPHTPSPCRGRHGTAPRRGVRATRSHHLNRIAQGLYGRFLRGSDRSGRRGLFPPQAAPLRSFQRTLPRAFSTLFSAAFPADFSAGCSAAGFAAAACSSSAIRVPST